MPIKQLPVYKDFKSLEITMSQSVNLAQNHLIATRIVEQNNNYWIELDLLTTEYYNFLSKKKKEI